VETAVLIPVKAFHAAKARLSGWLPDPDRERLARWMAERVVGAAQPLPTFVACDDDGVAAWAESLGAEVVWGPGLGLNGAIDHGVDLISAEGADHVIIAHGDLPLPDRVGTICRPGHVVLVPDRRSDGTNVMSRPCAASMSAAYGGGSFRRHLEAALAVGLPVSIRVDPQLSIDVDTIDDCRHPQVATLLRPVLGEAFPR
jgi:2-phospho-L-lactate guanylyltransferase